MDKSLVKLGFFVVLLCEAKEDSDAEIDLVIPCYGHYECPDCPCINNRCRCDLNMEAEEEEDQKLETLLHAHMFKKNSHDNNN
ncbi:hypothetical protein GmHk_09G024575 [Glycine max]|nr:hypothetical protein GmHk_09G024575 [Glycine max]